MAAAFLCAECDISIDPQTIAYLANDWKERINDKSGMMIIKAAREATKIAEYILGTHSDEADNDFKKLLATEAVKMLANTSPKVTSSPSLFFNGFPSKLFSVCVKLIFI